MVVVVVMYRPRSYLAAHDGGVDDRIGGAVEDDIAVASVEHIAALSAVEEIGPATAVNRVLARAALEVVGAGLAVDEVLGEGSKHKAQTQMLDVNRQGVGPRVIAYRRTCLGRAAADEVLAAAAVESVCSRPEAMDE